MRAETKYKGSLKLAAIGDALGWMTEFENSRQSLVQKFGVPTIDSFHEWEKRVGGRFHGYTDRVAAGSYSDDTQLQLSVARSIQSNGLVDQHYFAKNELPEWLLYARGAGRTIKNAARKIQRKSAAWNRNFFTYKSGNQSIDYRESGANGAAMRILPIALANFEETEKMKEEIFGNSIITHGHPRAILGAMLYGYAVNTILKQSSDSFDSVAFLTELGSDMHEKFAIDFMHKDAFAAWELEWNRGSSRSFAEVFYDVIDEAQEQLRITYRLLRDLVSSHDALSRLGCFDPATKGSGLSTVVAGIFFACKYSQSPIKGIEEAVNSLGTDTDSIAAFTGGLLGALHGQSVIPLKWKKVQDCGYLDSIAARMLAISEERAGFEIETRESNAMPILNLHADGFEVGQRVFLGTLGEGVVRSIETQNALTKGKYNLLVDVAFDCGQFCRFTKLLPRPRSGELYS